MDNPAQALEEARRAGIDLEALDHNLSLSHGERWKQHQRAVEAMFALRERGVVTDKDFLTAKQVWVLAVQHGVE